MNWVANAVQHQYAPFPYMLIFPLTARMMCADFHKGNSHV
jgi:hypothetical protein